MGSMAKPAQTMETTVEERIASLESHVQHIQADVTEVKASIQRLDQKIDAVDQRLSAKIDTVKDSVAEFRLATEKSFSRLSLWALMLYIALAVALLGVMAKGFGWIR
jgi:phage shock protein A